MVTWTPENDRKLLLGILHTLPGTQVNNDALAKLMGASKSSIAQHIWLLRKEAKVVTAGTNLELAAATGSRKRGRPAAGSCKPSTNPAAVSAAATAANTGNRTAFNPTSSKDDIIDLDASEGEETEGLAAVVAADVKADTAGLHQAVSNQGRKASMMTSAASTANGNGKMEVTDVKKKRKREIAATGDRDDWGDAKAFDRADEDDDEKDAFVRERPLKKMPMMKIVEIKTEGGELEEGEWEGDE